MSKIIELIVQVYEEKLTTLDLEMAVGSIVRCKDCWKRPFDNCPFNEYADYQPEDDFFCADGEPKKQE